MDVSLFIARKLRFKGRIAVVSIAVSFLVMIIAVSVSSGFRNEIRDGISFLSGDIQLTPVDLNFLDETSPVDRYPSYLEHVRALAGVESVSAAVYRAGIIKSGDDIHGVLFKGVEQSAGLLPGQLDTLPPMSVSIPARLASMLHLEPGDALPSYFIGEKVKVRKFTVHSIYDGLVGGEGNTPAPVDPERLRQAARRVMPRFPGLQVRLRRGVFCSAGVICRRQGWCNRRSSCPAAPAPAGWRCRSAGSGRSPAPGGSG